MAKKSYEQKKHELADRAKGKKDHVHNWAKMNDHEGMVQCHSCGSSKKV